MIHSPKSFYLVNVDQYPPAGATKSDHSARDGNVERRS
jgi:hypothetical protein